MERLTTREDNTPITNPDTLGDVCAMLPVLCHDYDCIDCPLGKIIDRLCEYEDTGLTPAEIMELKGKKNTAKVRRCQDDREHMTARVIVNGINIFGHYFY